MRSHWFCFHSNPRVADFVLFSPESLSRAEWLGVYQEAKRRYWQVFADVEAGKKDQSSSLEREAVEKGMAHYVAWHIGFHRSELSLYPCDTAIVYLGMPEPEKVR